MKLIDVTFICALILMMASLIIKEIEYAIFFLCLLIYIKE